MKKIYINCDGETNLLCEGIGKDDYYVVIYGENKGVPYEIRLKRNKLLNILHMFILIDNNFNKQKE